MIFFENFKWVHLGVYFFITRVLTLHGTVIRVKGELDQIREGMRLHGFLGYLEQYPESFLKIFIPSDDYSVSMSCILFL